MRACARARACMSSGRASDPSTSRIKHWFAIYGCALCRCIEEIGTVLEVQSFPNYIKSAQARLRRIAHTPWRALPHTRDARFSTRASYTHGEEGVPTPRNGAGCDGIGEAG